MGKNIRICIIGEWLHGLPDEGIYNLARNLSAQWEKEFQVSTIRIGQDLQVNRFFISAKLRRSLRTIRPDYIFYISPSSAKIGALFRARLLKLYASRAKVMVVATQPVAYRRFEQWLLPLLAPDAIFVQSPQGKEVLEGIHCPLHFLPSGVDLARFSPVTMEGKIALRKRYGFDEKAFIVLHVGHIKPERNVNLLCNLAQLNDVQPILVGSASTLQDEVLINRLKQANVHVVREFIPNIEEFYQLADVYLFPVASMEAAIGVPLSVLEAMACNLPVITTRFGGLPLMFQESPGLFYYDMEGELPALLMNVKNLTNCATREKVNNYSWDRIALNTIKKAQEEGLPWN